MAELSKEERGKKIACLLFGEERGAEIGADPEKILAAYDQASKRELVHIGIRLLDFTIDDLDDPFIDEMALGALSILGASFVRFERERQLAEIMEKTLGIPNRFKRSPESAPSPEPPASAESAIHQMVRDLLKDT